MLPRLRRACAIASSAAFRPYATDQCVQRTILADQMMTDRQHDFHFFATAFTSTVFGWAGHVCDARLQQPRIGCSAAGGQAFTILLVKLTKKRHTNAKNFALKLRPWTCFIGLTVRLLAESCTRNCWPVPPYFHRSHAWSFFTYHGCGRLHHCWSAGLMGCCCQEGVRWRPSCQSWLKRCAMWSYFQLSLKMVIWPWTLLACRWWTPPLSVLSLVQGATDVLWMYRCHAPWYTSRQSHIGVMAMLESWLRYFYFDCRGISC